MAFSADNRLDSSRLAQSFFSTMNSTQRVYYDSVMFIGSNWSKEHGCPASSKRPAAVPAPKVSRAKDCAGLSPTP